MERTVKELAELVDGEIEGDGTTVISGLRALRDAGPSDLSFLANARYASQVRQTRAGAVVVGMQFTDDAPATLIRCVNPDAAFGRIAEVFAGDRLTDIRGVHERATVAPDARLGDDVSIQSGVVIEPEAQIGDRAVLQPGVYIGRGVHIGADCLIYPNVTIREGTEIGDRVIVHAGTVIGADGFGYVVDGGRRIKIPQIGRVVIEDEVEIGANVTIDRARFDRTVIGQGAKIDNLVQIAHNVVIGANTVIVSLCAIAGSTTLGRNCVLAGQVAIDGHLTIGDNVTIAAKSGVTKDIPSDTIVSGFPAIPHREDLKLAAEMRKLGGAARRLARLERVVERLADRPTETERG